MVYPAFPRAVALVMTIRHWQVFFSYVQTLWIEQKDPKQVADSILAHSDILFMFH